VRHDQNSVHDSSPVVLAFAAVLMLPGMSAAQRGGHGGGGHGGGGGGHGGGGGGHGGSHSASAGGGTIPAVPWAPYTLTTAPPVPAAFYGLLTPYRYNYPYRLYRDPTPTSTAIP